MAAGKKNLVEVLSSKVEGLTKKDADATIVEVFDVIAEALENGEKVQLTNFGTLEVYTRAERKGRNPQTGEEIHIPAKQALRFKAGKGLEETVQ